jgi:uncharacterized membrane protein
MKERISTETMDRIVGRILQAGLLLSMSVMAAGLLLTASRGGTTLTVLPLDGIVAHLIKGESAAVLDAGILLLFATPLFGVLAALVSFSLRRDRQFVTVAAVLIGLLIAGFVVALH